MTIKCVAIDDEPLGLQQISGYIHKTPFLELVAECKNAFEALDYLENHQADVLFVDINMPDLNGLNFVKSLETKPLVVFTTAYSEYALEGFKVDATDYLLKPINYSEFLKAANKVQKQMQLSPTSKENVESNNEYLFIKSEYKLVRINFNSIKYIEGMKEYVRIHLENEKPVMSLLSMKALEARLPADKFMRVHRSFIVNLDKVSTIERFRIIFDKVYIPVSDQYKDKFQAFINSNFMK